MSVHSSNGSNNFYIGDTQQSARMKRSSMPKPIKSWKLNHSRVAFSDKTSPQHEKHILLNVFNIGESDSKLTKHSNWNTVIWPENGRCSIQSWETTYLVCLAREDRGRKEITAIQFDLGVIYWAAGVLGANLVSEYGVATINTGDDILLMQLVENISHEAQCSAFESRGIRNNLHDMSYRDSMLRMFAIHLFRQYCILHEGNHRPMVKQTCVKETPRQCFKNVINFIQDNLQQNIGVDDLAKQANMSTFHFSRQFKAVMGRSPHQYIVKCRLDRAKGYLNRTNWPISRVAYEVGYENQAHFCQAFKRFAGSTPGAYRRANNF